MAKLTPGPAWTVRPDSAAPTGPLAREDRDRVVHALNERRHDPRVVFSQRFEWRGWWVELRFGSVAGRLECIALDVLGDPDGADQRPLTSLGLRELPFGRFVAEARREFRRAQEDLLSLDVESGTWSPEVPADERRAIVAAARTGAAARLRELEAAGPDRTSGRPRMYGADHFRDVANVYSAAWSRGGKPTREVAERFGVSTSAAAKWVARARQLGMLPATSRGRAVG